MSVYWNNSIPPVGTLTAFTFLNPLHSAAISPSSVSVCVSVSAAAEWSQGLKSRTENRADSVVSTMAVPGGPWKYWEALVKAMAAPGTNAR